MAGQIRGFQLDTLRQVTTVSLIAIIDISMVLGNILDSSTGGIRVGTSATPMPPLTSIAVETPPGTNVRVNPDSDPDHSIATQWLPALAVGPGGTIHIAWADERFGNSDVFYARSTDGGASWSPNVRINDDATVADQSSPTLKVDDQGCAHIAWEDNRNGNYDIYYARSINAGMAFSANQRVNDDAGQGDQFYPDIAIGLDGTLHLAWQDGRNANDYDIYYTHSTNSGTTFFPSVRVNDVILYSQNDPAIGVDSAGRVHVAWTYGGQIYYANSSDSGASFSASQLIGYGGKGANITPVLATVGSNQVHVAWVQYLADIPYFVPGFGWIWIPVHGVEIASSSDGGGSFSEPQRISDRYALNSSMRPDVAASDSVVHVVFYRNSYGDNVIEYDRSSDGGDTWGTDRQVGGGSCCPSLDVDTIGRVHVAWSNYQDASRNICYAGSTDGGQTFPPSTRVSDDAVAVHTAPDLAAGDGVIHVVWSDNHSGTDHIYYARSVDGGLSFGAVTHDRGLSFGAATQLDQVTASSICTDPAIALDTSGHLHVIWAVSTGYPGSWYLWYSATTNGGGSFSPSVPIGSALSERPYPALAVGSNGHIHVVWEGKYRRRSQDPYQYYIYYARSTDGGASFSTPYQINDVAENDMGRSDIAIDGSEYIYVAWHDAKRGGGDTDIYADRSTDGGVTWNADVRVNEGDQGATRQCNPVVTVDSEGGIHVAWQDSGGEGWDIYHTRSTDYGVSYGPSQRTNDLVAGDQTDPAIAAQGDGQIYLAWADLREDDGDVRYAESTNGGSSFSASVRVNDQTPRGWQGNPAIATSGDRVHLVWEDTRNGPPDIYYAGWRPASPTGAFRLYLPVVVRTGSTR